jgi:mannose-6-phosphate isomerase-like protein (cupin superfamily)
MGKVKEIKMYINSKEQSVVFDAGHGELIYELLGDKSGLHQHSLAHVILLPGKSSRNHYHPIAEESYYILKGEARMEMDGQTVRLKPGQTIAIPPQVSHKIYNDQSDALEFLAICAPAWHAECSVFLE